MGTEIRRVIRATAASISSRLMRSPSGYPRLKAIPALVVARAAKPASTKIRALPASHALGSTSIGPSTWSRRSVSAWLLSSAVRACCMGGYLIASPSGVKALLLALVVLQTACVSQPAKLPAVDARWNAARARAHAIACEKLAPNIPGFALAVVRVSASAARISQGRNARAALHAPAYDVGASDGIRNRLVH